jgi:hypothetical protein
MLTFGYLIVRQRAADVVTFPDGTVELHPTGHGARVAEEWNASRVPESDDGLDSAEHSAEPGEDEVQGTLDELIAAWEAALADLDRDQSPFGNPEGRRASFLRRNPRPTRDAAFEKLREPTARR